MNKPFVLGLTGSTGAGKSEVAQRLCHYGFSVIDADAIARAVVEKGSPCLTALVHHFSEEILHDDGTLNRARLAALAFASPEQTQVMNQLMHPAIVQRIQRELDDLTEKNTALVLLDVPLLFQSGLNALCDRTVAVVASAAIREARICTRDGLTKQQAQTRMNAQPANDYYEMRADYVLYNDSDRAVLNEAVAALWEQIQGWQHEA